MSVLSVFGSRCDRSLLPNPGWSKVGSYHKHYCLKRIRPLNWSFYCSYIWLLLGHLRTIWTLMTEVFGYIRDVNPLMKRSSTQSMSHWSHWLICRTNTDKYVQKPIKIRFTIPCLHFKSLKSNQLVSLIRNSHRYTHRTSSVHPSL